MQENTNVINYKELFQIIRTNKLRHCAYIIYSVKTRFLKRDML